MKTPQFFNCKKIITTLLLFTVTTSLFAQNSDLKTLTRKPNDTSELKTFRINFLGFAGLNYEFGLGGPFSINLEGGLGFPLIKSSSRNIDGSINLSLKSVLNPYLNIEGRYYYNLLQRKFAGKLIDNFSGDYLAAFYHYSVYSNVQSSPVESGQLLYNMHYFGVWWGMQRNLGCNQRLYFDFSIGPCLRTDLNSHIDLNAAAHLGFGIQW
ncbi:MAG TPA: hypothetical protein VE978_12035 [Chitinophagales bacterium]|nr:hypothetical protein [Chitinophagales bacterium]